jgi:hypothetical protein
MESPELALPLEKTPFERLKDICADAGVDPEKIRPSILERMRLLAETTETVKDCERAVGIAENIFAHYESVKPAEHWDALERKIVVIGSLFSDVGKTGPAEADAAGQRLVAEMFAVENVPNGTMPVAEFFAHYFPENSGERTERFRGLGLDPAMSMREFWNLHSTWTLHIIQGDGVPMEAVAAAATHHILENVNPDAVLGEDGKFTKYFGENASFDRPEKLVILLDKYDAARRRGNRTHEAAIVWLREFIGKNPRFADDRQFAELIGDLDAVMGMREKELVEV